MIRLALVLALPLAAFESLTGPKRFKGPEQSYRARVGNVYVGRPSGRRLVRWAPLAGPSDLPMLRGESRTPQFKERASGLVRMETPVLYFYSAQPTTLSVRVGFPQGWITEWYPRATSTTPRELAMDAPISYAGGEIRWDRV